MTPHIIPDWGYDLQNIATELFTKGWPEPFERNKEGCCFHWALCGLEGWQRLGRTERMVVQAGSANWRFRYLEEDEPGDDCFGYHWDTPTAAERVRLGMSPEWHVWLGLPEEGLVVDLSARFQEAQCRKLLDHEWSPDYVLPDPLVATVEECILRDWTYDPTPSATYFAARGIVEQQDYLRTL
jgi:hypothetical protein